MEIMGEMTVIKLAAIFVVSPVFAFLVFRAAARGWFSVKHDYTRRLIGDIKKGDGVDG